jgi:hypothetical protein
MADRSAAVTRYIEQAEPFARPILRLVREVVHRACPKATEAMKWSMPFFLHEGSNLAYMAAFRAHAGVGFWRQGPIARDPRFARYVKRDAMGAFGRLGSVRDLPPRTVLAAMIRAAMEHQAARTARPAAKRTAKKAATKPAKRPAARPRRPAAKRKVSRRAR